MREYSTPLQVDVPSSGNLTDDLERRVRLSPELVLFRRRRGSGWSDVTATQFHAEVREVARGLVASGIEPGDRVALLSRTRYEWAVLDYAISYAGAVSVPVYETSGAEQVAHVLADSGARALLVETAEHAARVSGARARLEELHHVWAVEGGALDLLRRLGGDVSDEALEERRTSAGPGDLATIIYTSGTTGAPKGCMLTHGNLRCEIAVTTQVLRVLYADPAPEADGHHDSGGSGGSGDPDVAGLAASASTLLFLPLAHVFPRVLQLACVRAGVTTGHTGEITSVLADLRSFSPSFVLAVPRVFEMLFNTVSQEAAADGKGRRFARAVDVAMAWSRAREDGRVPVRLRARHAALDRTVYRRMRQVVGGRCRFAVSGGATLSERLAHVYRGIGIEVLEGYGLTESTAALAVNLPGATKVGTVGRPLPGTSVRVAEDGELLFRGGQVFTGYWHDEEASAAVLDADGWLHSGDVGEIDEEGFVKVTGRKTEILVTAGGKSVSPVVLEDRLRAHPLVDQCLVVGDGQPFIGALVTLDPETLRTWCAEQGKRGDVAVLAEDDDLRAAVQQGVDEANRGVSRAEAIRRFVVVPRRWSEETGHLTPSLKLRRSVVVGEARDDIARLYGP